jgi:hypothetical protein
MARNADTAPWNHTWRSQRDENKDCTVNALRVTTGSTYGAARQFLADECGRVRGKGLSRRAQVKRFTKDSRPVLGHTFTPVLEAGHSGHGRITIRRFIRENPRGTFYCCKSGHAFAIVDGVVHDHSPQKPGALIQNAWRVEPTGRTHHPAQLRALLVTGMDYAEAAAACGVTLGEAIAAWNALPYELRAAL